MAPDLADDIPLELAFNFNRVLIAGHGSTFEVSARCLAPLPLENLTLLIESRALLEPLMTHMRRLAPGVSAKKLFEVEPARPGRYVLRCSVTVDIGGSERCYVAERPVTINNPPEAANISIDIHDIQSNRSSGANAGLGEERHLVIQDLVKPGAILTLNDLINLDLGDRFDLVALELDYAMTRGTDRAAGAPGERLSIPGPFLACVQPGMVLQLLPESGQPGLPFLLVARDQFRIGRSRGDVDLVAWFLPRSPENDERTMRLSKVHVIAEISSGRLALRDSGSGNGSTYDGAPLSPGAATPLDRRAALILGNDYALDVLIAKGTAGPPTITNLRLWSGPDSPVRPVSGSVRFEPTHSQPALRHATWLLTQASFGSSRSNPIVIDLPGVADIQGQFHYFRRCFWIENRQREGISVNDLPVGHRQIVPLATDHRLRLGSTEFRVEIGN